MAGSNTDFNNTILMINNAKGAIKIDRDPNFDDMKLIFDGVTSMSPYMLKPGDRVHVGSTYGNDIGVVITYDSSDRYMEMAVGPSEATQAQVWNLMADGGSDGNGPLAYCLTDLTYASMTMTWSDK